MKLTQGCWREERCGSHYKLHLRITSKLRTRKNIFLIKVFFAIFCLVWPFYWLFSYFHSYRAAITSCLKPEYNLLGVCECVCACLRVCVCVSVFVRVCVCVCVCVFKKRVRVSRRINWLEQTENWLEKRYPSDKSKKKRNISPEFEKNIVWTNLKRCKDSSHAFNFIFMIIYFLAAVKFFVFSKYKYKDVAGSNIQSYMFNYQTSNMCFCC